MNPLIVALDLDSPQKARELVDQLGGEIGFYKVGLELYATAGMDFVRELIAGGKDVFLDLKLYDIGETVKRTVTRIAATGVRFTTIHGSGTVMRAAAEGRDSSNLKLLAVTVLTSFDREDLADLGYPCAVSELVALRVRRAIEARIDGIVCSPLEAALVRQTAGPGAILVTPGVRSAGAGKGDQKRVATPASAMASGADYLVVGRPIRDAENPAAAFAALVREVESALATT